MPRSLSLTLQLFLAAACALACAKALGLSNPFWAAMPVWVVQQAFREDLVMRAILRVAGTLAGALISLTILYLDPSPAWMAFWLAIGVGASAALAYWIGSVMSYGSFISGITILVVLLPYISSLRHDQTLTPFALAVDRILCTLIGVVCVTAVTFPFTPLRPQPLAPRNMNGRVQQSLKRFGLCAGMACVASAIAIAYPRFDVLAGCMTLVVYPMIMSSAPDPRPILKSLLPGVAIGVMAGIAYLAATFPLAGHPVQIILITVGFLAAGASLRAHPRTAPIGLDANMCFLLVAEVGTWRHGLTDAALAGVGLATAALLSYVVIRFALLRPSTL